MHCGHLHVDQWLSERVFVSYEHACVQPGVWCLVIIMLGHKGPATIYPPPVTCQADLRRCLHAVSTK